MTVSLKDLSMNQFGGGWTNAKIEILVEYARAYLTIMAKRKYKLLYFDGFAGSGTIINGTSTNIQETIGAARRIIEIDQPRPFDTYYFVEKDEQNFIELESNTKHAYPHKDIHCVNGDCNSKLKAMSQFLNRQEIKYNYRTLAYIDPCGMQLNWDSLQSLKGLQVDAWILVPTGLGVNRLLVKSGAISTAWMERLQVFLGLSEDDIRSYFYRTSTVQTLWGIETITTKEEEAIDKSALLYQGRLNEVFRFVSNAYVLRNSSNSIMFHLYFATNNAAGQRIANDIVYKYQKFD